MYLVRWTENRSGSFHCYLLHNAATSEFQISFIHDATNKKKIYIGKIYGKTDANNFFFSGIDYKNNMPTQFECVFFSSFGYQSIQISYAMETDSIMKLQKKKQTLRYSKKKNRINYTGCDRINAKFECNACTLSVL